MGISVGAIPDPAACARSRYRRPPHRDRARQNLLLNVTPVNGAEAWADFERSDFGTVTLRLRPLEFEPDLVRRDLYNLEIENVTDPALHTLFRAKQTRSQDRSQLGGSRHVTVRVRVATALWRGSPHLSRPPRSSCSRPSQPKLPTPGASRPGVRGGGSCGVRSIPCGVSRLPGSHRGARRHLRTDGVVRSAAHPRSRRLQGGPRRALAASRGRHPCRHLPERRQATAC